MFHKQKNAGISLVEILLSIGLASVAGMMVLDTQKVSQIQMGLVKQAFYSQVIKKSVARQVGNGSYIMGDFRSYTSTTVRNCIPDGEKIEAKQFGNLFSGCISNGKHQVSLKAQRGFSGVPVGQNALNSKEPAFYTADGSLCKDSNSASCTMAMALYFEAICSPGACGDGPDLLKFTLEIRDHNKDKGKNFG